MRFIDRYIKISEITFSCFSYFENHCLNSHLVIQLFVEVGDVLHIFAVLARDGDASCGRQQVVDDGSVVARLDALLIFGAQLLVLRDVLPCNMDSSVTSSSIIHQINMLSVVLSCVKSFHNVYFIVILISCLVTTYNII